MSTKQHNEQDQSLTTGQHSDESTTGSRRSALRKIATGGALGAAPKVWIAPAVVAVTLPTHAQASPQCDCSPPSAPDVSVSNLQGGVVSSFNITLTGTAPVGFPTKITNITLTDDGLSNSLSALPSFPVDLATGQIILFGWVGTPEVVGKPTPKENQILTISWECCDGFPIDKDSGSFSVDLKPLVKAIAPRVTKEEEVEAEEESKDDQETETSTPDSETPEAVADTEKPKPDLPEKPEPEPEPEPEETNIPEIEVSSPEPTATSI